MKNAYKVLIAVLLAATLVLSGCVEEIEPDGEETEIENGEYVEPENGGETEPDDEETKTDEASFTTVLISDAPSDNFSHINVTFSQVKIHKYANENDSGWIVFDMEPKTIDMLYLHKNNLSEELGVKNLSVGNYSKLWIVVDSATGVLKETGKEITFHVPSGDLKIQQSFEIKEGNTTIDVEIDLDRSILYVPQGNVYKLLPQLGRVRITYDEKHEEEDKEIEVEVFEADAGGPYTGIVNQTIEFNGSATGGVENYSWYWEFGDGTNSTEQNPQHIYNTTGNYSAVLTVTDDEGTIAMATAEVEIE